MYTEDQLLRDIRLEVGPMGSPDHRLVMWDTYRMDNRGCTYVGYRLYDGEGKIVFEGEDYSPGPMHGIDSDESVAGLLGFLSCRPGDTDDEYFQDYTPAQLDYADTYGEDLSMYSIEDDDGNLSQEFKDW